MSRSLLTEDLRARWLREGEDICTRFPSLRNLFERIKREDKP